MAEYKTGMAPAILTTLGLGSCVGVVLYDFTKKIGGLSHVMLPDSTLSRTDEFNPGKFADTAIDALLKEMIELGANPQKVYSKIAGGAQMFKIKTENNIMQIGKRNVEAVRKSLEKLNIKIVSEDVEGNYGRTIEFDCDTGELLVKTLGHGVKTI